MNIPLIISGIYGFIAIAFGAYVEHGLKSSISITQYEALSTALRYNFFHALIIAAIGLTLHLNEGKSPLKLIKIASAGFILGTFLFSFSIYASVLFDNREFVKVTPSGGIILMLSWLVFCISGFFTKLPAAKL